ncbi:MAG: beta-lactamase family protein [Lachnospiraceae bacterium]|nr:beta-lactamase family protein [Lachnospiraceae bacterium]
MHTDRIGRAADNMEEILRQEIRDGGIPGASFAVLHHGETVIRRHINYAPDAIFRVYSMSKPITAVAAHILWERGKLDWNTPLFYYLPEYEHMNVLTDQGLVPAARPIVLMDLLRMTSGIVYPDTDPAGKEMDTLFSRIQKEIAQGKQTSTQELCRLIAEQPLAFHPGERWRYGLSCDVMGAVIEKVADRPLSEFYENEIFRPLGMEDTGFYVPKEKQERFTTLYEVSERMETPSCEAQRQDDLPISNRCAMGESVEAPPPFGQRQNDSPMQNRCAMGESVEAPPPFGRRQNDSPMQNRFAMGESAAPLRYKEAAGRHLCLTECLTPPAFESGGAGIVSTLDDYAKFADMLAHYGSAASLRLADCAAHPDELYVERCDGLGKAGCCRILGRKTVESFEHGQLSEAQKKTIYFDQIRGFTYGNFMRVYDDRTEAACSGDVGEFGWDGWTGPYFMANPKEEFAFVLML